MSSFTDPSSIVLIVGAIFIFIFIIHGLWFSNKPQNRKLQKNNQRDQEISKSNQIGKVRIVTTDSPQNPNNDDLDITSVGKHQKSNDLGYEPNQPRQRRITIPSEFDDLDQMQTASVSVNHKRRIEPSIASTSNAGNTLEQSYRARNMLQQGKDQGQGLGLGQGQGQGQGQAQNQAATANTATTETNHALNVVIPADLPKLREVYELILTADKDKPYLGEEIEELCNQYGFIQGFIQDTLKIYFVYENAKDKTDEVFRICSMEAPYYFPEDMHGFQTSAIALYMSLPPQGKAYAYFKAMRMASEIFINHLGGHIEDQNRHFVDNDELNAIGLSLQHYDAAQNMQVR